MVAWNKILGVASIAGATALLGMVAFDVPYFKSVYFLRISLPNPTAIQTALAAASAAAQTNPGDNNATAAAAQKSLNESYSKPQPFVDLGVLGFCIDMQDGKGLNCSSPKIGYSIADAGAFLNGSLPLPTSVASALNTAANALTKVLVLHLVAFAIALIAFAFGILAFLGVPLISCCSSLFCGLAGSAAFAVLIFDIAFFEILKNRLGAVQPSTLSGLASSIPGAPTNIPPIPANVTIPAPHPILGNAVYLTAAAFALLLATPILFLLGKCCGCLMPDMSDHHHKHDREKGRY